MTDKIMIDGVDVSECKFLNSKYFSPCGGCKNDHNCYYKQLKRKEEELQAEKQKTSELQNKYKIYDELENWFKIVNLPKTGKGLKQRLFEAERMVRKLEAFKEEIKEIINNSCEMNPNVCSFTKDCPECTRMANSLCLRKILQKCEALND